ncbi:MAG: magnesium-translocating P-type ATPase [Rickettsiales bacterium]|jgi:Mg2+-importing ATPase|nr:magnesium-translocating P-type ATPase [Rickettsiales bacterium]
MEKEITRRQKSNFEITRRDLINFSAMDVGTLVKELKTDLEHGLSTDYVENLQNEHGYNEIGGDNGYSWYGSLLKSIFNPFNVVLIILTVISLITGDVRTGSMIIPLVMISSLIEFMQENKSNGASEKLKSMIKTTATTIRDGRRREIEISELVKGDIIYLSAGDIVPADLRIIESRDLFISQSSLTGESEPLEKFSKLSRAIPDGKLKSPIELEDLCFMGTNVVSGTALAVVLSIGMSTYFGSMTKLIGVKKAETNFNKGLADVSLFLIKLVIAIAVVVFLINWYTKGDWFGALMFAISTAIGMTPEMLPVIISSNLTRGVLLMSKKRTIVKNMNSIQNFGAMDVLCSDKTGTLTENVIVLQYHLNLHGEDDLRVLKHAYLNSNFQTGLKNLLDLAIIDKAVKNSFYSLNYEYQKIDEIPFDFTRKRMSVLLRDKEGKLQMITKGAIEEMLQICRYAEYDGKIIEIDEAIRDNIIGTVLRLNNQGMRVLAIAQKNDISRDEQINAETENNMVLMGYLSFLDPPKQTAKSAIEALKNLNVRVKVLTGDSDIIAANVCEKVGIKNDKIMFGSDIESMDDKKLMKEVENFDIFAKLTPQQKLKIIKSLKAIGHVVGFMGDGINDAPAMREADVAISVDSAVDIARESADIILLKKDLNVLVDGVIEGRKIFCNIIKYVKMTLSSNFGNMFSIILASIFLPFLPMLPVQMLLLNIFYDISQISIPWDNVDEDYLKKQKKWDIDSIKRFVLSIGPISSVCDVMLFVIMYRYFGWKDELFHSGWFIASMVTQTVIIHLIRTDKRPIVESNVSTQVFFATTLSMIVSMIIPYTGIGSSIYLEAVPLHYYLWLAAIVLLYVTMVQFVKNLYIGKYKNWL